MKYDKIQNDLQSFIDENKLTFKEMGELAGISPSTISRCLSGETNILKKNLKKIADVIENFKVQSEDHIIEKNISKKIDNILFEFDGIKLEHTRKYLLVKNQITTNEEGQIVIKLIVEKEKSYSKVQ